MYPVSLPDDIVVHIQSFMNFKDAARSATVSTRLYDSWYGMKNLVLDDREFLNLNAFWFGAKQTIRRYTSKGLKMDTLSLRISCGYERYFDCKKFLEEAANLGLSEISIHLSNDNFIFLIPSTVLTSPHLHKFTLTGGALHVGQELANPATSLRSLNLLPNSSIGYRGDFVHNIVLKCPFLLHLTCPGFLLRVDLARLHLGSHSLVSLSVHNITYADNLFFNELIRFFTSLRKVELLQVFNSEKLHICSNSLAEVRIVDRYRSVTAVLRVPNLQYFHFLGVSSSTFTFESTDRCWTSAVNVLCYLYDGQWLRSLYKLLNLLPVSNIHLSVRIMYDSNEYGCEYTGDGEPISIESLDIVTVSPNPGLVEGLFSVCVPNYFQYNADSELE